MPLVGLQKAYTRTAPGSDPLDPDPDLSFPNAVHVLVSWTVNRLGRDASLTLAVYRNAVAAAKWDKREPIGWVTVPVPLTTTAAVRVFTLNNQLEQGNARQTMDEAYAWLKANTPEYAGAVDVPVV